MEFCQDNESMSCYGVMREGRVIIIPSFFIDKASFHCTHWHRFFPLKKAFSKTYPSFLTLKEGSTFLTKPLFPQGREDVTALLGARNRYALRLAGHQSPRQIVRDGTACSRWNSDGQDVPGLPSYLASAR